ncbi:hypothetical protein Leryth_009212 [Lithospermum erythrorhizon]|nr:hypothetical protein Leryth_009212 [Lithospermum erythrorhizon]
MFIDNQIPEFDMYENITTTTTTTSTTTMASQGTSLEDFDQAGHMCNNWSPVVDWEALSAPNGDDLQGLIQSMMDENTPSESHYPSFPSSGTFRDVLSHSISPESPMDHEEFTSATTSTEDAKGLNLIHLLMAAAEALTGAHESRELARVILVRLKDLVSPNEGTNMERLAAYFTEALQSLLEGTSNNNNIKNLFNHQKDEHHQSDILAAFQLLQDMSPYVKFGHFTANQAIVEAVKDERRVHVIDFDIMEGIQWASLMQALVSRTDGRPAPHLRITALTRGGGGGRRSIGTVQETGKRLAAFAASIGQPFSYHQCKTDSDETFKPTGLKLVKGEAIIMNCMLHLPHFSHRWMDSVASFLAGSKTLCPKLITLVEEEVSPLNDGGFVGRFMDSLHHYSALYDSLEAGFPLQGRARALVERVFLGPRIGRSIAQIYRSRGEEKGGYCGTSWSQWLDNAMGFSPVSLSFANHCQAKLLLGLFNDGYRVEELGCNKLVLGWKSRRLLSASIWTCPEYSNLE